MACHRGQPISDEEMAEIQEAYDEALTKHGPGFKGDFGWAATFLDVPAPHFTDLERAAKMDHMRPPVWHGQ